MANEQERRIYDRCLTRVGELEAENANLRELVRHAFACIRKGEDEYGTDWSCIGCEFDESCVGFEQLASVAYELGIEADE